MSKHEHTCGVKYSIYLLKDLTTQKIQIVNHRFTPLLNSRSLVPSVTLKTRMTVPLSEAVASLLPLGLKATAARLISKSMLIVNFPLIQQFTA